MPPGSMGAMHKGSAASESSEPAAPPSRWRRAQAGCASDARLAIQELAESYWYCIYVWWRRLEPSGARAATATLACIQRWLNETPLKPGADIARLREWIPARLVELATSGVKLIGKPPIEI